MTVAPDPAVCPLSLTAAANVRRLLDVLQSQTDASAADSPDDAEPVPRWNLSRLARETGLAPAMISHLVAGKRNFTLPTLARVAAALGVHPAELLVPLPEQRENTARDESVASG